MRDVSLINYRRFKKKMIKGINVTKRALKNGVKG